MRIIRGLSMAEAMRGGIRGLGASSSGGDALTGQIQQMVNYAISRGALGDTGGMEFNVDGQMSARLKAAIGALVPGADAMSLAQIATKLRQKWRPPDVVWFQGGGKPAATPMRKRKRSIALTVKETIVPPGKPWYESPLAWLAAALVALGGYKLVTRKRGGASSRSPLDG